jgi:hypothetical protein
VQGWSRDRDRAVRENFGKSVRMLSEKSKEAEISKVEDNNQKWVGDDQLAF